MHRMLPLTSRLRNKWLGGVGLCDGASEIIELSPAADREQPAAISLPSEFDRVLSLQEETTPEIELRRLQRGAIHHAPTMAYRLDAAVLKVVCIKSRRDNARPPFRQLVLSTAAILFPTKKPRTNWNKFATSNSVASSATGSPHLVQNGRFLGRPSRLYTS
jgi:hypothetical protein